LNRNVSTLPESKLQEVPKNRGGDIFAAFATNHSPITINKLAAISRIKEQKMIELIPLCTAIANVEPTLAIGVGPNGARSVGAISSVSIKGERLNGTLASPAAADWVLMSGPVGVIDVRMTIRTDDGALIYITYGGRLDLSNPAEGIFAYVAPVFETGDERYQWLNKVQGVGKGKLSMKPGGAAQLEYEFYAIR